MRLPSIAPFAQLAVCALVACRSAPPAPPAEPAPKPETTPNASPPPARPAHATGAAFALLGARPGVAHLKNQLAALGAPASHPGKRPWSRAEVEAELDALVAERPRGLTAMGAFAHARARTPMENSDPLSAFGGGPGPDMGAFNEGAMLVFELHVEEAARGADAAAALALYVEIATMPLPVASNSGGATRGDDQRDRLVARLRATAKPAAFPSDAARAKTPYRDDRL